MRRVVVSRLARVDLDDLWLHVARERAPEIADALIDAITERVVLLGRFPAAGRLRADIAPGVRG